MNLSQSYFFLLCCTTLNPHRRNIMATKQTSVETKPMTRAELEAYLISEGTSGSLRLRATSS